MTLTAADTDKQVLHKPVPPCDKQPRVPQTGVLSHSVQGKANEERTFLEGRCRESHRCRLRKTPGPGAAAWDAALPRCPKCGQSPWHILTLLLTREALPLSRGWWRTSQEKDPHSHSPTLPPTSSQAPASGNKRVNQ